MPLPIDRRSRSRRRLAAGALLAAAALTGSGCGSPTVKDDAFIDAGVVGILDIEGGECFSDPEYSAAAAAEVVVYTPCADGADNQSYHFVHVPDGPWDRAGLAERGWDECGAAFRERWSGEDESGLSFYPILPTEETWADGDRVIMCAVYDPDGRLEDSVLPRAGGVRP